MGQGFGLSLELWLDGYRSGMTVCGMSLTKHGANKIEVRRGLDWQVHRMSSSEVVSVPEHAGKPLWTLAFVAKALEAFCERSGSEAGAKSNILVQ